jgi:ribosomal protein S14
VTQPAHDFTKNGYKRRCKTCGQVEALFLRLSPSVSEPSLFWRVIAEGQLPPRRFAGWSEAWRCDGTGTRDFYLLFVRISRRSFHHSTTFVG